MNQHSFIFGNTNLNKEKVITFLYTSSENTPRINNIYCIVISAMDKSEGEKDCVVGENR